MHQEHCLPTFVNSCIHHHQRDAPGILFTNLHQLMYSSSPEGCTRNIVHQPSSTDVFIITRGMHREYCLTTFINWCIHHHQRDAPGILFTNLHQLMYSSSPEGCTRNIVYQPSTTDVFIITRGMHTSRIRLPIWQYRQSWNLFFCMQTYCNQENLLVKQKQKPNNSWQCLFNTMDYANLRERKQCSFTVDVFADFLF
jgi:hypothetical protein